MIRVLIRTAGVPAFRRALPVYLGLVMIAAVLFGPTGMHPATLVASTHVSPAFRLVLWIVWTLALAPAARALFWQAPLDYLRALPAPRGAIPVTLGGLLLALELPWLVLFAAGGDGLDAAAALVPAAGLHALIAIPLRTRMEVLVWLAALGAAALCLASAGLSREIWLAVGSLILVVAVPLAWRRAPERHVGLGASSRRLPPGRALAIAHCSLVGLYRDHGSALVRGFLLAALGAGAMYLIGRANPLSDHGLATISAVVATLFLAVACMGASAPLLAEERALGWLLASTDTEAGVRTAARLVAGAVTGGAFALGYSGLVIMALPLSSVVAVRITAAALATGVALAWLALRVQHVARRSAGAAASRAVGLVMLAIVAQLVAITAVGDMAVPVLLLCAFALSWERT